MGSKDLPEQNDKSSAEYDGHARDCEWFGGGPIFGMMYEYLKPRERLLDLGIGTGMGSEPFHLAGLRVYGIDKSEAMLNQCRKKGFAEELSVRDLRERLPYQTGWFDHAISLGVFHFLEDVEPLVEEVSRVLREGGTFGVTTLCPDDESGDVTESSILGFTVYKHSQRFIEDLLVKSGLSPLKTVRFIIYADPSRSVEVTNRVHIATKGLPLKGR
jgi:predicted TPR repeat methyltransferase